MSGDPYDDIPLPSEPVLSEEETLRQLRDDLTRPLRDEIARLRSQRDELAGALREMLAVYAPYAQRTVEASPEGEKSLNTCVAAARSALAKLEGKR